MIPFSNIAGRMGNQMFLFAFAYNYAKKWGLDRYFQDPRYFKESVEDIKAIFQEGMPAYPTDMVAIHVRRGDYVGHHFYVDLMQTDYYEKAMEQFPDKGFVVFSDDIEFCKRQPVFKDCEFTHGTEIEDMNNFASCIGHIIANSSFSYWGAFISPYTKKVVAPKAWYTDGKERTVCPKEWLRI